MKRTMVNGIFLFLGCGAAFGQTTSRPAFEVADIQIHKDMSEAPRAQFNVGRVDIVNMNMRQLVMAAFNIGPGVSGKLLDGFPDWVDSTSYDIVAKAGSATPVSTLREMLETLLEERFKMTFHREDRPMQVWALTVAKGGPKLQPAAGTGAMNCGPGEGVENMIHLMCTNMSMADLAKSLPLFAPRYFDMPMVDDTRIAGKFDVKLDWYPVGAGNPNGDHAPSDSPEIASTTIFDTVQHLGFKLEKRKQGYPVIVIDHLERNPTQN